MARTRLQPPVVTEVTTASAPEVVTASASVVTSLPRRRRPRVMQWQERAWDFYDLVGEFRYVCDLVGAAMSKVILYAQRRTLADTVRLADGPAFEAAGELFGGPAMQSECLRAYGIHMSVAGECNVVAYSTPLGMVKWEVVSPSEVTQRGDTWYLRKQAITLTGAERPLIIRLWRPHPRRTEEATSPARAVLPILAELVRLTKAVGAQADSKLTGGGIYWVPRDMDLPKTPVVDGEEQSVDGLDVVTSFAYRLEEAMEAAISEPETAAARTPIVIGVDSEMIGKAKLDTFWTPFDKELPGLRQEAIGRLALGLDIPPEILTGLADANHWAAWAVDEAAIKSHTEPLAAILTTSLTDAFLHPAIMGRMERPHEVALAADTSLMRLRPNRSKEAVELFDRGEIDAATLRRETGFDEESKPDEAEQKMWLLRKIASGSATPEQVGAAAQRLGVDLGPVAGEGTREARPDPSLREHPERSAPDTNPQESALALACEMLVLRALERAGNRIASKAQAKIPGVPAVDLYRHVDVPTSMLPDLLVDAFGRGVEVLGQRFGLPTPALGEPLAAYTRTLLATRAPVAPEVLTVIVREALARASALEQA